MRESVFLFNLKSHNNNNQSVAFSTRSASNSPLHRPRRRCRFLLVDVIKPVVVVPNLPGGAEVDLVARPRPPAPLSASSFVPCGSKWE